MGTLLTFHSDSKIKKHYVDRVRHHQTDYAADYAAAAKARTEKFDRMADKLIELLKAA